MKWRSSLEGRSSQRLLPRGSHKARSTRERLTGLFVFATAIIAMHAVSSWTTQAQAATCPNEAIRAEQGAASLALPDCRAYEMVSPPHSVPKADTISSVSGERFAYYSYEPPPGSDNEGLYYLSTRGPTGWSAEDVIPSQGGVDAANLFACFPSVFYSEELTYAVLADGWHAGEQICDGDYPALVAGEPRGYGNLFLRDNEEGSYQLVDVPQEGAPSNARFVDGSSTLDDVVFLDPAKLTPEAPPGLELYEWRQGTDHMVTFLPDGEPVAGTLANSKSQSSTFTHAVSANGETVFFYADGNLYARRYAMHPSAKGEGCSAAEPERACTVQVDAVGAGASGTGGGGTFVDASENGSVVFFTDESELTREATAQPKRPDLYEYNLDTGVLTDLTVLPGGADVLGFSGESTDGSSVYFVAKSVLTGGQANSYGEEANEYGPNLYLYHDGVTTFIAALQAGTAEGDATDWQESDAERGESNGEKNSGSLTARVSPDGKYFAFNSVRPLDPEYDNEAAETQDCNKGICREIFVYDAETATLSCVSCVPDGELPTGPAEFLDPEHEMLTPEPQGYIGRNVLDDGRVFFDTRTPLVPQAVNGEVNVYEYEDGQVSLVSSGTGTGESKFLDASASGDDVFFSTAQGLVQADTDNMLSVYDARVEGGFPPVSGEASETPACTSTEACERPASEPPAQLFPASATLPAVGVLAEPPAPVAPLPSPVGGSRAKTTVKRSLTPAQKLAEALKACAEKPKAKRASCKTKARRELGTRSERRSKTKQGRRRSAR